MGKIKIHKMEKIQEIKNVSSWNTSDGSTMYTFLMVLESGKTGEVNAKTNDRYAAGETVWITQSQSTNYGEKWKMSKKDPAENPYSNSGGGNASNNDNRDAQITASWAIGQALSARPELVEDLQALQKLAAQLMETRKNLISNE